jgi:hypothetical protein
MGFKHQIELPRRSEIPSAAIWTLLNAFLIHKLVNSQMGFANPAIDHRIRKTFDVPGRLQHGGVSQNRSIHANHIVTLMDSHLPPVIFEVPL